jgi:polyphosphate kinase
MDKPVTWRALLLTAAASVLVTLAIMAASLALLLMLFLQPATDDQGRITSINLPETLPFRITMPEGMTAKVTNPIKISVPLKDKLSVPIRNAFTTEATIDARIPIDMNVRVDQRIPVDTSMDLDTEIQAKVFGVWVKMPIKGSVPINLDVPVQAEIPVQQSIPLKLKTPVTVKLDEVFTVPVNTTLTSRARLLTPLVIQPEPMVIGIENATMQWPRRTPSDAEPAPE